MQQPLCHLYFLTVMEHLWSEHHQSISSELSSLAEFAVSIQKTLETAADEEAVLLWIELQAVIQVLIQHLAWHFDPEFADRLSAVSEILEDING